jgi:glycosyltransferase involved in cell wall biosynthesis
MIHMTFILVTRNRAAYVEKALANVRELKTGDDEFIVIDGGSTDGTVELLERSGDVVTEWISEPDRSEAHAANKGLLRARGRYVKFITDDDYTHPGAMRQAARVLAEHPEIDALQCGGEHWELDQTGEQRFKYHAWFPPGSRWADDLQNPFRSKVACGLGMIISPRIVPIIGLLDGTYATPDTEYIMRILAHRLDYRFLSVMLYRHTTYPHSVIANQERTRRDRIRLMLRSLMWDPRAAGLYPLKDLAEQVGVSDLELERMAVFLFRNGRQDHRAAWKGAARAAFAAGRAAWAAWERVRPMIPGSHLQEQPPVAPIWDGSLR